jgi:hypothetical protein
MKRRLLSACCLWPVLVHAEDALPLSAPPAVQEVLADSRPVGSLKTVEHDGQIFELATSTTRNNVATDEYVIGGEKIAEWTQLVTVQRLTLAKATATDEFLAYFQKRVQAEAGSSLEILKQAKAASVFAVRFPRSERNDEQVMICLAFVDSAEPTVLNIVQYALKPSRVPIDVAEPRIRSWRDKFITQATALAAN